MTSIEQKTTLQLFAKSKNCIILGPGGTGKTYIIRKIHEYCIKKNIRIAIAAMTGKAASIIEGARTLHSLLGINYKKSTKAHILDIMGDGDKNKGNKWKRVTWRKLKILVIDEISMLGVKLFEMVDEIARAVRKSNLPFGGIHVIGSGDFLQLPPINDDYCFKSPLFTQMFSEAAQIQYTFNFRQNGLEFKTALNEIRIGQPSQHTIDMFSNRLTSKWQDDGLFTEPLHIFPLKRDVAKWNKSKMDELDTEKKVVKYEWKIPIHWSTAKSEYMLNDMLKTTPIEPILTMKIGASVMHTVNNRVIDKFNGSTGVIIRFTPVGDPVVRFSDGVEHVIFKAGWTTHDELGSLVQYPLIVAWAVTVHKIQGSELDCAQIDIGENIFEYNQIYVALSRVRTLEGVYLSAFDPESIRAHPDALDFYKIPILEEPIPEPSIECITDSEKAANDAKKAIVSNLAEEETLTNGDIIR